MHAKPDLRVRINNEANRSGSVISYRYVAKPNLHLPRCVSMRFRLSNVLLLVACAAILFAGSLLNRQQPNGRGTYLRLTRLHAVIKPQPIQIIVSLHSLGQQQRFLLISHKPEPLT